MEVILLEDLPKVGKMGEIVKVSDGYGRNFLIPQKKAMLADRRNIKQFEHRKRVVETKRLTELRDAQALLDKIQSLRLKVSRKVGEQEKLFGSVTSQDIASLMADKGVEIDRHKIVLEHPIKDIGDFEIPIKLFADVVAVLKLAVVAEVEPE